MIKALLLAAALLGSVAQAASISGTLAGYEISSAELGSCRLKGISTSSTNYKYYASVSAKDVTLNAGCARCIDVTLSSNASAKITAYVVDVSSSSSSGSVKLSDSGMTALGVDTESTTTKVSYQFVACPSSFLSGNIKACLMEGGSNAYIPLQFYNAKQVITNVTIDGVEATMNTDSYLFYVTTGVGDNNSTSWYKSMTVSMANTGSNSNVSGTFEFTNSTGCATSDVQFASSGSLADSSASSDDGSTSSSVSSSNLAAILGGIFGGIAAVLIVVILVVMIRRRRFSSPDEGTPKDDGMSALSPKIKAAGAVGAFGSSYDGDAAAAQAMSSHTDPDSPSNEYLEAGTPAAVAKAAALAQPKETIVPVPVSVQEAKPPVREVEPQPRSTFRFSRNPSTSPRRSSMNPVKSNVAPVPTLPPPVVPVYHETAEDEDRSSFDIDDMRESEANHTEREVSRGRHPSYDDGSNPDQYSAPYSYGAQTVTSPQSYVRATSLRRNTGTSRPSRVSSQVAAPTVARNNGTTFSDASTSSFAQPRSTTSYSDAPTSYAAGAPQRGPLTYSDANSSTEAPRSTTTAYSDAPSSYATYNTNEGPYDSTRGNNNEFSNSFRGSTSGGYSRDSLNILGYPYAKKSSRNVNQN